MSFDSPDDRDKSNSDDDQSRLRIVKKKKKDKDKGYKMFEADMSDGDANPGEDGRGAGVKLKKHSLSFKFSMKKDGIFKKEKEEKREKDRDPRKLKESLSAKSTKKRDGGGEGKSQGRKHKKDSSSAHEGVARAHSEHLGSAVSASPQQPRHERPIFGVPLATAIERHPPSDGIQLPVIVRECIDYVEEHGLLSEGIYRVSGVKSKVQQLRDAYNRLYTASGSGQQAGAVGGGGSGLCLYEHDPSVVASLLKQFLRELPEPVLTAQLMPAFEDAAAAAAAAAAASTAAGTALPAQAEAAARIEAAVQRLKSLIGVLPECNRLLLSWMMVHMTHVVAKEKTNKMSMQNVSIVLSPTMQISHRVLYAFFIHAAALFGDIQLVRYAPASATAGRSQPAETGFESTASMEEELRQQEALLSQLHAAMQSAGRRHHGSDDVEERLWEVQRSVTQLKRKLKLAQKTMAARELEQQQADGAAAAAGGLAVESGGVASAGARLSFTLQSAAEPLPSFSGQSSVVPAADKQAHCEGGALADEVAADEHGVAESAASTDGRVSGAAATGACSGQLGDGPASAECDRTTARAVAAPNVTTDDELKAEASLPQHCSITGHVGAEVPSAPGDGDSAQTAASAIASEASIAPTPLGDAASAAAAAASAADIAALPVMPALSGAAVVIGTPAEQSKMKMRTAAADIEIAHDQVEPPMSGSGHDDVSLAESVGVPEPSSHGSRADGMAALQESIISTTSTVVSASSSSDTVTAAGSIEFAQLTSSSCTSGSLAGGSCTGSSSAGSVGIITPSRSTDDSAALVLASPLSDAPVSDGAPRVVARRDSGGRRLLDSTAASGGLSVGYSLVTEPPAGNSDAAAIAAMSSEDVDPTQLPASLGTVVVARTLPKLSAASADADQSAGSSTEDVQLVASPLTALSTSMFVADGILLPEKLHRLPTNGPSSEQWPLLAGADSSADDEELHRLIAEEARLMWEEEELLAIRDELHQKIATEQLEAERLRDEIAEYEELRSIRHRGSSSSAASSAGGSSGGGYADAARRRRASSQADSRSASPEPAGESGSSQEASGGSSSDEADDSSDGGGSSGGSSGEDTDELVEQLERLEADNRRYEEENSCMVQKIHEERLVCLGVKLQIRLLQQQQLGKAARSALPSLL